jgi:thiol-disulfide isomerase/thioredoxin
VVLAAALVFGLTHQGGLSVRAPESAGGRAAPEFAGIVDWENSGPLRMAGLRGKVVLVDFWTYSCINCQRTFPFLRQWNRAYAAQGLVIVGVHSPEFDFEKDVGNIRQAIRHYGVEWPVAVDSEMATWNAYGNQYWPAEYLIDSHGKVVHSHFGEGDYEATEMEIRTLLKEAGHNVGASGAAAIDPSMTADARGQTQELYASASRGYDIPDPVPGRAATYTDPGGRRQDGKIYWNGGWEIGEELAEHTRESLPGQDYLLVDYRARQVHIVAQASGGGPRRAYLSLDGADLKPADAGPEVRFEADGRAFIDVERSDLYTLVKRGDFGEHVLKVSPVSRGFRLFTLTFGS